MFFNDLKVPMKAIQKIILSIVLFFFLYGCAGGQDIKTYVHPRAEILMPVIKKEVEKFAPEIVTPWYFPALIEHESCITLKHRTCWSPEAELKNKREQGVGLGQITRVWSQNGKIRFDNLGSLKKNNWEAFNELSWSNVKQRPDLQVRATIFMVNDIYRKFSTVIDPLDRLMMTDSGYNGGVAHVNKARVLCNLTKDCDAQFWYDNVEKHLPKSRTPDKRYGGKSMYEINTRHVKDVFENRMPKFEKFFEDHVKIKNEDPSVDLELQPLEPKAIPSIMPASGIPYRF